MNLSPILMTPSEFGAMTRLDFVTFIERVFFELNPTTPYLDNFHVHVLAAELEAMRAGGTTRLIVNLPPRNLKSIIVSIAFVAWLLGQNPSTRIICVSYGQDLAERFARQCRQVMQSAWYRRLFPKTQLSPTRLAANDFETTAGGFRLATSVDGVIMGTGADYILIDDPMKAQEAISDTDRNRTNLWYRHSLITRLDDKLHGRIAVVMQRLHQEDMAGYVQQLETWRVVALSAIAPAPETYVVPSPFGTCTYHRDEGEALHPEREPLEILETYRRTLGPEYFSAQFLQAPVSPGGNIVKIDQFQRFDLDAPPPFERIIVSLDPANKSTSFSGYSVFTVWGIWTSKIYLIDVIRARMEYHELRETALALARGQYRGHRWPDVILIEDKASGQSLIQDLNHHNIHTILAVTPTTDKVTRMNDQTGVIADGCVFIPREAPWLPEYLQEMMAFPKGRYDDQVDATSQVLKWFNHQPGEPGIIGFYRMEGEKWRARFDDDPEDNRIVTLRGPKDTNLFITRSGEEIHKENDGFFRMKWRDAKRLRRDEGWEVVEKP